MNVLVVHCHPDPESFGAAIRDRVLAGLGRTAHDVRHLDLYAEGFDPVLCDAERRAHLTPLADRAAPDPQVVEYAALLQWCEALVLVYPTWWGAQPAMLKGWFDRTWVRGVAWDLPEGTNRIHPMLRNIRRIVVVTTHGSSKLLNSVQGEGGKRIALRTVRTVCRPLLRTKWLAMYGLDTASDEQRRAHLDRVERWFARMR